MINHDFWFEAVGLPASKNPICLPRLLFSVVVNLGVYIHRYNTLSLRKHEKKKALEDKEPAQHPFFSSRTSSNKTKAPRRLRGK
jgi:hypothetical protein